MMGYNWDWSVFLQQTPDGAESYLTYMLIGAGWTLAVSLTSSGVALAFGSAIGVMRTLPGRKTQWVARSYVEVFRNIPLLVQMFVWYFVVPELLPSALARVVKQSDYTLFCTVVVSLGLYTSPRIAEQLKAAIFSMRSGQKMAGMALGMSTLQTYRFVLLPMAFRIVLPPLTSEILGVIKNSAVASILGLMELTGAARTMQEYTFHTFEAFAGATLMYCLINIIVIRVMQRVERITAVPGYTVTHARANPSHMGKS